MSKTEIVGNSWKPVAKAITEAWATGIEHVFKTGHMLAVAKDGVGPKQLGKLPHGEFELMIKEKLPFGRDTALKLRAIVQNHILTKAYPNMHLPNGWTILYQLTLIEEPLLVASLADGRIHPAMTKSDVRVLRGLESETKGSTEMSPLDKKNVTALKTKLTETNKLLKFSNGEAQRLSKEVRHAEIERDDLRVKAQVWRDDPVAAFEKMWNNATDEVRDQIRNIVNGQPNLTVIAGGKQ